jgi:ribosomal protein S18 acetylase RimI-like enzyme
MLRALRVEATRRGALEILINVDADDTAARRFYERHGFSSRDPDSGSEMLCYLGSPGA